MSIHARTLILELLEEHPEADEVFENYGVEVTDELMSMTLKQVCRAEGINYWELKSDLVEAIGWDGSAEFDPDDEEEDDDEDEEWAEEEEEEIDDDDMPDSDDDDFDDDDDDDDEDGGDDDDEEGEDLGDDED